MVINHQTRSMGHVLQPCYQRHHKHQSPNALTVKNIHQKVKEVLSGIRLARDSISRVLRDDGDKSPNKVHGTRFAAMLPKASKAPITQCTQSHSFVVLDIAYSSVGKGVGGLLDMKKSSRWWRNNDEVRCRMVVCSWSSTDVFWCYCCHWWCFWNAKVDCYWVE